MRLGTPRFNLTTHWPQTGPALNSNVHGPLYGISARAGRLSLGLFVMPRFDFKFGGLAFFGHTSTWTPGDQYHARVLWLAAGAHIHPRWK